MDNNSDDEYDEDSYREELLNLKHEEEYEERMSHTHYKLLQYVSEQVLNICEYMDISIFTDFIESYD